MSTELTAPTNGTLTTTAENLPLDQNPAAVYIASLAPGSRRTMRQALDIIAAMLTNEQADAMSLPWGNLRFQHTTAIRSKLAESHSASTANKMLSALRGVLKAARRLGQISADDYMTAIDFDRVNGEALSRGRALSAGEMGALMVACANDHSPAGARDAAMIAVLYSCGLRRAEIVSLDVVDFDADAGALTVHGKRNKTRLVPVVNGALDAARDWLIIRGSEPGALFTRIGKSNKITLDGMTSQAVWHILGERARQAGVKDFSPHDMRRSFISDLLDAGADIATVQKLAGHANVTTTARYDRRPEEAKRKAAQLLHVPYTRRQEGK